MRRPILMVIFVAVGAVGLLARPALARAECPFFVIPPATDAATSAREVVVGTVVENVDENYFDFRLRIDHVLRGPAEVGDVRRMNGVYPGWPLIETGDGMMVGPCEPIPGWKGNVIALSLDALAPDGVTRYSAASWISGKLPFNREVPRTTLAEMRALAGMPPTDTDSVPSHVTSATKSTTPTHEAMPLLLVVFLSVFALVARRLTPSNPGRS
ncbi:MAG: hypothetical protein K0S97_1698 [Chloroflexota bacterium]|jgi:hypothetical protein|nr:hypothetical protein [Chloroflexota bacterium]